MGQQMGNAAAMGLLNSVGPTAGGLSSAAFTATGIAGMGAMGAQFLGYGTAASKGVAGVGLAGKLSAVENNAILGGFSRLNPVNSMMMGAGAGLAEAGGMSALFTGAGLRAAAAGAMGTAGLLHPISIAAMAATAPMIGMYKGAQQYNQTSAMLGAYNNFANPYSASGRGFSENQMSSMVSQMRSFQADSPFISMRDMQQTMTRFNEMGMNQGERDAQEFTRKFTQMAKTVTAMSKAMGTTMDEASKVFAQMRGVGFYTGSDVMTNTLRSMTLRGEGISGATTLAAQAAGGGITRAGGLGTTPGARAVGGVMSMFTGARGTGALTNEEMMNITGAATPDQAIAQLSTSVTGSLTNFYTQTGVGQAMLAALGSTDASGRFTGKLDTDMVEQLRAGKININNLVGTGRSKVSTRDAALSFKTKGQDVAGALLSQGDPTAALGAIMQSVAGDKFNDLDPENLISLLTERIQGLSRKEAEAMTKLYREGEKIRRESQRQMRAEMQAEVFMTDVKERHSFEGFKRRMMGGMADAFAPIQEAGQMVSVEMGIKGQRIEDTLFGVTRMGSATSVRDARLARILKGEDLGDVAALSGESGFGDADLTRRALLGQTTAADFTAPTKGQRGYQEYTYMRAALSSGNFGKHLAAGGSAEEFLRGMTKNSLYTGDLSSKEVRQLMGAAASAEGSDAAIRAAALLTDQSAYESLSDAKARQAAILGEGDNSRAYIIGGTTLALGLATGVATGGLGAGLGAAAGGALASTLLTSGDEEDLDKLYASGGADVIQAMAKSKLGNKEFTSLVNEAYAKDPNKVLEYLKGKGVDTSNLTLGKIREYQKFVTDQSKEGMTADQIGRLAGAMGETQQIMDFSNLAAMATASATAASGIVDSAAGYEQLSALAAAAGSGRSGDVSKAQEELFRALEGAGIKTASEEEYGTMATALSRGLAHRNIIKTGSVEDVQRMLKQMDISEEDLGIKLSEGFDREQLAKRIGAYDIATGSMSSGGAFTETTQREAVKYYKELAASVADVTSQVMVMQERERAYQAERGAAPLPPNK
jgi:hypothetical protein